MTEADSHPLVCRFGALGDMVLITPLLRQLYLRGGLPCDVVTIGRVNALLYRHLPWVRAVYIIDSRSSPYWFNRSQKDLVKTLRIAGHRYAWICETHPKSYRILERAGIDRHNSVTQLELEPVADEHYCETWTRLGNCSPPGFDAAPLETPRIDTELRVGLEEVNDCRQWLRDRGLDPQAPLVCIQAGSKRTTRRGNAARASNTKYWPPQLWGQVIDSIVARLPAAQILLCGVAAEMDMCRDIAAQTRAAPVVQSLADDLPLRRLLALLSLAHSCISVDTGPAHAAAALQCPLVVLFGKANPAHFRPISAGSPVRVVVGKSPDPGVTEPDIAHITPAQVLAEWCAAIGLESAAPA